MMNDELYNSYYEIGKKLKEEGIDLQSKIGQINEMIGQGQKQTVICFLMEMAIKSHNAIPESLLPLIASDDMDKKVFQLCMMGLYNGNVGNKE